MGVLSNYEPKEVLEQFEALSMIPRRTFEDEKISNFLVEFAKGLGLKYIQEECGNVIIFKPGTPGHEDREPIIMQAHMDMVCQKTEDSDHDFTKDPLELFVEDDKYIGARNTSLGGDDGIGMAYAMAVLASTDLPHPPIEALFTIDEEESMNGAHKLDASVFKGKAFLNIDAEEDGVITVGCSGGCIGNSFIPVKWAEVEGTKVRIEVKGLLGGHSGNVITKQRGNGHKIMGRILFTMSKKYHFNIVAINGGSAANVISQINKTDVIIAPELAEEFVTEVNELGATIISEFNGQEPKAKIMATESGEKKAKAFDDESNKKVIQYLNIMPDGLLCFDRSFPDAPETSLNAGLVETCEDYVRVKYQIRGAIASKLDYLVSTVGLCAEMVGGRFVAESGYPAWAYREDSKIRPLYVEIYKELFGKDPVVETTHGGLEGGIFYSKNPEFDIICVGPNLSGVHSVAERVDMESVARIWELFKELLKRW